MFLSILYVSPHYIHISHLICFSPFLQKKDFLSWLDQVPGPDTQTTVVFENGNGSLYKPRLNHPRTPARDHICNDKPKNINYHMAENLFLTQEYIFGAITAIGFLVSYAYLNPVPDPIQFGSDVWDIILIIVPYDVEDYALWFIDMVYVDHYVCVGVLCILVIILAGILMVYNKVRVFFNEIIWDAFRMS